MLQSVFDSWSVALIVKLFIKTKQKQSKINIGSFTAIFFNLIILLMWHSSIFQIIFWKWKDAINPKMQTRNVFWQNILQRYLCYVLRKFFIKAKSNYFSKTYSDIESTRSIETNKEEIVLSHDNKELFLQSYA